MDNMEEMLLAVAEEIDRMAKMKRNMETHSSSSSSSATDVSAAIRRAIAKRRQEKVQRACIACPNLYHGGLICPQCGEFGEPIQGSLV